MQSISILALSGALILSSPSSPSFAQSSEHVHEHGEASAEASAQASAASEGEVKKVDKDAGKLTIKHGELKNLNMPPMTMVFRVKDKALLDRVKPGDKVNFVAEKVNGQLTVMQLSPSQ